MTEFEAVYERGVFRPVGAVALPEATRVRVVPVADDPPGTAGDEQSNDPAAIAAWLAEFDAIPPLVMSAVEEAAWRADREARRPRDAARIDRLAESLQGALQ